MKLSKQELEVIRSLRGMPPHDTAITIKRFDGSWDVSTRGIAGGTRGTGTTFEAAWDSREIMEDPVASLWGK
jgi:hypothetical protein